MSKRLWVCVDHCRACCGRRHCSSKNCQGFLYFGPRRVGNVNKVAFAHFERLSVNVATRLAKIDSVDHRYRSFYRCKLARWMKALYEVGGLTSKYENGTWICPSVEQPPGLAKRRRKIKFIRLERDFSVAASGAESGKSLWLPKYGDHVTRMHKHILGRIAGDTRKWDRRH